MPAQKLDIDRLTQEEGFQFMRNLARLGNDYEAAIDMALYLHDVTVTKQHRTAMRQRMRGYTPGHPYCGAKATAKWEEIRTGYLQAFGDSDLRDDAAGHKVIDILIARIQNGEETHVIEAVELILVHTRENQNARVERTQIVYQHRSYVGVGQAAGGADDVPEDLNTHAQIPPTEVARED